HGAIAFLLDHLPSQLHLIIASRADPPLPLARRRARGDLTELRAADLRFLPDEAAAFLNDVMRLGLSAADVAALETRTEGWVAGLQLAALSMRGRADVAGFISEFAGDARYIVDYLIEEVLQGQSEDVRRFLLQTSILDRMSGGLCDAVTGRHDGRQMLEALERGNLFLVPLDDNRRWYRYHHLFADVLRSRAMAEGSDEVATRHRRASVWYEANGLRAAAIWHALTGGDVGRAADLVEAAALPMLGSRQEETLHGWLTALPDEVVRARPVLSTYYAFSSFGRDGFDAAESRLRDAERWLEMPGAAPGDRAAHEVGMVVVDEAGFRSLEGTIAIARAYRAGAEGDVAAVVTLARRALEVLPDTDDLWCGAATAILGIALWTNGELEAAYRGFAEGRDRLRAAGYTQFETVTIPNLADIRIAQGRLREATDLYERALRLSKEQRDPAWGTADLYVGLSELRLERDDLEAATRFLSESKELGEHAGLMETRHRWYVAMAGVRAARGDLNGALGLLDEAERQFVPSVDPDLRPIAALRARVWIAMGRLGDALGWVRERGLSTGDEVSFRCEFEHLTLVRVLIARDASERTSGALDEALALLGRLLKAAEEGRRMGGVIEILVTRALALVARGDDSRALASLRRALTLAEPEGYARVFTGEGEAMRTLLRHVAAGGLTSAYAGRLLAGGDAPGRVVSSSVRPAAGLAELLTSREVEILRLIAAGMRNQEIADRLFVGLSTVKRHIANAYGKLHVTHRTEAVARANELHLL
ncbi:MAG: LuxR C-terminal-related transcriptional regulator, partial [Actinomycetota bacterium]|nr:LuxR C-terminal-related transcriptional regulator [Actinomycetota bacterium]